MIELVFLGTGASVPSKKRNHSSVYFSFDGVNFLFDCGEGTQRQLTFTDKKSARIDYILLSHWHADHSAGLIPLLHSMSMNERSRDLTIIGPKGTVSNINKLIKIFPFNPRFRINTLDVSCAVPKTVLETDTFKLYCLNLSHPIPCIGFSFVQKDKYNINISYTRKFGLVRHKLLGELQKGADINYNGKLIRFKDAVKVTPGLKFIFLLDTSFFNDLTPFCSNADILVCDSTFDDLKQDDAHSFGHMTVTECARLASAANVKELFLTHISPRYKSNSELLSSAKKYFKNVTLAEDFLVRYFK